MRSILVLISLFWVVPVLGESHSNGQIKLPRGLAVKADTSVYQTAGKAYKHKSFPRVFRVYYPDMQDFVFAVCNANGFNSAEECSVNVKQLWKVKLPDDLLQLSDEQGRLSEETNFQRETASLQSLLETREQEMLALQTSIEEKEGGIRDLEFQLSQSESLRNTERTLLFAELERAIKEKESFLLQVSDKEREIGGIAERLSFAEDANQALSLQLSGANANLASADRENEIGMRFLIVSAVLLLVALFGLRQRNVRIHKQDRLLANAGKQKSDASNISEYRLKINQETKNRVKGVRIFFPKRKRARDGESFHALYGNESLWVPIEKFADDGNIVIKLIGWSHDIVLEGTNTKLKKALKHEAVIQHYRTASSNDRSAA